MHPLLDELRRVLELEQRRRADNAAVMGGLDGYLANWRQRAATAPFRREIARLPRLDAGGYAALGPQGRLAWLNRALAWTARQSPASGRADRPPIPSATTPRPARPAASKERRATQITIESPITVLSGVSAATAGRLARLGVASIRDLLYHLPHRYNDLSAVVAVADLQPGLTQTAVVNLWEAHEIKVGRDMPSTEAIVGDASGNVAVVWFGNPYVARSLQPDMRLVLSGRVGVYRGQRRFESPEWEPLEADELTHAGRIVPVYPLTAGLNAKLVRRLTRRVVDAFAEAVPDLLPDAIRVRQQLPPLAAALRQAHFPDDFAQKDAARRRLAFDEMFLWQLGLRERRRAWRERDGGQSIVADRRAVEGFVASLPFTLTTAQRRVLDEALADMARPQPMTRLLQGDVGSGKTVVAAATMVATAAAGFQSVLMAPTEILAEQHYRTLCQLFGAGDDGRFRLPTDDADRERRLALLTGATRRAEREAVYAAAVLPGKDSLDILVGTHAVIQEGLEFARLGLAIVDEQHRFGVMQRSALTIKGANPHLLVMSATPIPRSLALVLYGDLDLSVIDEMPPGRLPVQTRYLRPRERAFAHSFIRDEAQAGRQAFVVCPLIEESDTLQTRAAVAEFESLSRTVFPDLRLGLLHGRLSGAVKDAVMRQFQRGEIDVLVSTPVIEVGIDVPNATVMLIEGAERFGLAQLHQFRGRVGRGAHQSYCLLLSDSASAEARQRLALVEANGDGFALAEADLRLRGPGEFFGTRQSGPFSLLRAASLADVELLAAARAEAIALLDADPELERQPELRDAAGRLWRRATATG